MNESQPFWFRFSLWHYFIQELVSLEALTMTCIKVLENKFAYIKKTNIWITFVDMFLFVFFININKLWSSGIITVFLSKMAPLLSDGNFTTNHFKNTTEEGH